jgi:hypothetical protein
LGAKASARNRWLDSSQKKVTMTEWIFFGATILVSVTGFLISRELSRVSDELKHLRQDVFRLSVDLAKLEERLDSII